MTNELLDRVRTSLQTRRDEILAWLSASPDAAKERVLGEMADPPVVREVETALKHIDHDVLGKCVVCNQDVEPELLELDFTTCVCLTHYDEKQQRELENDLEMAARVQQHLFPCCMPALPGVQIAAHAVPARIVSGDYYDYFPRPDDTQGFAIADVMGKGVSASMLMANLQASLRILGPQYEELDGLARRLNELFLHNLRQIRFISLFLMGLDTSERLFRYCNAGHNPALFYRADMRSIEWLRPTGPAIGLTPEPAFRTSERTYGPGDVLVLYTDGIPEARNGQGAAFGETRLTEFIVRNREASADRLLAGLWTALSDFTNGSKHDDVTAVVMKFE